MRRENARVASVRRVGGGGLGSRAFFIERRNVAIVDWDRRAVGEALAGCGSTSHGSEIVLLSVGVLVVVLHDFPTFGDEHLAHGDDLRAILGHAELREGLIVVEFASLVHPAARRGEEGGGGRRGISSLAARVVSGSRTVACVWKVVLGVKFGGAGGGGAGAGGWATITHASSHGSTNPSRRQRVTSGGRPMVRATSARSSLEVTAEGSTSSSKSSSACVRVAMDVFQYRLHLSFCSRGLMSTFMRSSGRSARVKASFGDRGVEVVSLLQPRRSALFSWRQLASGNPTRQLRSRRASLGHASHRRDDAIDQLKYFTTVAPPRSRHLTSRRIPGTRRGQPR